MHIGEPRNVSITGFQVARIETWPTHHSLCRFEWWCTHGWKDMQLTLRREEHDRGSGIC